MFGCVLVFRGKVVFKVLHLVQIWRKNVLQDLSWFLLRKLQIFVQINFIHILILGVRKKHHP